MGGSGGIGGVLGQGQSWRLAMEGKTRSLIVRGSEKNLQTAADLVAVLDLPKDKPIPRVKSLRAFRLRHAEASALAEELKKLEMNVRIVGDAESNTLVVAGPEAEMKEIADVIEQLDVENKAPKKSATRPDGGLTPLPAEAGGAN
jgi:type II secretory pathway component GspD/PulD (secretin)